MIDATSFAAGLLWSAALFTPLLFAAVLMIRGLGASAGSTFPAGPVVRWAWVSAVPALALALLGSDAPLEIEGFIFGATLQLDAIARPLVFLAAVLYGVALAFIPRSPTERQSVLTTVLLVCFAANVGVFVAVDIVTFYLCFTVISFVGFAAVIHNRTTAARRAGNVYIVMTVLGEAAVLGAMMLIAGTGTISVIDAPAAVAASDHQGLIVGLLIAGFGVKAGTVPLHVWLPLAHPAAPTAASAVLSGVMLNAGLVGWLRFLPLGEVSMTGWGTTLLLLAIVGAFLAVPAGLLQDDPKVILAYSSISQMGFIAALVAVALIHPELAAVCVASAVLYALHHGLVKGALFLGVQVWDSERFPRWLTSVGFVVAGASLAGLPLTSGYVAKYASKEAVGDAALFGVVPVADLLPLVGVGSTLLLVRFAWVMARRSRAFEVPGGVRDGVWLLLSVSAVVPVVAFADFLTPPVLAPELFSVSTWIDQSWPVAVGLVLAALAIRVSRLPRFDRSKIAHPRGDVVPPGDIVLVEEKLARRSVASLGRAFDAGDAARSRIAARVREWPRPSALVGLAQRPLTTWIGSGIALLVLLTVAVAWGVGQLTGVW